MVSPQTVFTNGRIRPLDAQLHEAVAIQGNRITHVGTSEEVRAAVPGAQIVDLDGGTVLPAFTDSHTHFKRASAFLAMYIDFGEPGVSSVADVAAEVSRRAAVEPSGAWIQGDGLDPTRLAEKRFPTRHELDSSSPDHPVVLRSVGRHVVAANSLALQAAGIHAETPDPQGGRIERDVDGEPTGVLHEEAKLRLDANRSDTVIPPESTKDRIAALSRSVEILSANGIAAIHEMPRDPDQISDWLLLKETEQPRVRVRFYVRGLAAQTNYRDVLGVGLRSGFGDEWLKLGGVKFSLDGSGAFGNAMTYDPYPGTTDDFGLQRVDEAEFREALQLCHGGGLQVAVHAIGPRAVDMALDAFDTLGVHGEELASRRHRIEHAYLPGQPGQLERIRDLGLVLSTQPAAIEGVGDSWRRVFENEDMRGAMPLADAVRLGIPTQLNSDFPCAQLNPFVGIDAAVNRRTSSGHILDADQAIPVETALRLMTYQPANTAFEESWRGSLEPGKVADLVVVDRDPMTIDPSTLADTTVLKTIVNGEVVFEA